MSDDRLNQKLCDYLNAEFAKKHFDKVDPQATMKTNKEKLKKLIKEDGNIF
jgi:hypothetical protein